MYQDFGIPGEMIEKANKATENLLPKKSKEAYNMEYETLNWTQENYVKDVNETVLLGYFGDLAKTFSPSSLWSKYSMEKKTLTMDLTLLPLHKYPEYISDCCNLINDEWKRSNTARLHSLQNSCDNLPTSLILLKENKLIGHVKLSTIPSMTNGCFVESVVIDRSLRGKGYGSVLMKETEIFCKQTLGLDTIYLSTRGQEKFYAKLGYVECMPVSIYGSYVLKTVTPQHPSGNNVQKCVRSAPLPPPLPKSTIIQDSKTYMKKDL